MKKPTKNIDYVKLYAEKLKSDNSLFKEMFSEGDFKVEARKYLKKIGLLTSLPTR